jgi:Uma2 family endonuclease
MGATTVHLSFQEFEALPDSPGKQELLEGELIELPPAESKHNRVALRTTILLNEALTRAHADAKASELGEACHEMGYLLGPRTWLQPDVSITHAAQMEGKYFEGAPAIAIEIVSPSDRAGELRQKTELYFRFGAREVWRVFPNTRQVVVDVPGSSSVLGENDTVSTTLLPGLALPVASMLP